MSWIADIVAGGISPRQCFDDSFDVGLRLVRFSARVIKTFDDVKSKGAYHIEKNTGGDELGWTLWEKSDPAVTGGDGRDCSAWAASWPCVVGMARRSPEGAGTRTSGEGAQFYLLPDGGNQWPDSRFQVKEPNAPSWAQLLPVGWTGTLSTTSFEYEQVESWHPDFLGLVASNRGDPAYSTKVFDLAGASVDRQWSADLHSLVSVENLDGAGLFGNRLSGNVLSLNMGASGNGDTVSGLAITSRTPFGSDQVYIGSAIYGGPFADVGANAPYRLGTTTDGKPVHPLRLAASALFYSNDTGRYGGPPFDGPLPFVDPYTAENFGAGAGAVRGYLVFSPTLARYEILTTGAFYQVVTDFSLPVSTQT